MTNQIDRVALAIYNAERKARCLTMAASLSDVLGEHHYRELARVAVAAMAEPAKEWRKGAPTFRGIPLPILFVGGYRRDAEDVARAAGLNASRLWQHCTRTDHVRGRSVGTFVYLRACGHTLHEALTIARATRDMRAISERDFLLICKRNANSETN